MNGWTLVYEGFDPAEESLRETLFTLGNGYFATRGATEESHADDVHYPGTYLAGGYNRLETEIAGQRIENEDLVNWPNWLCLTFRTNGGEWLDLTKVQIREYRQELCLQTGIMFRHVRVRDRQKRETTFQVRRLVHMGDPNLAAIEQTITAENWSGSIEVRSSLDGRIKNTGVKRYAELRGDHLVPLQTQRVGNEAMLLGVRTKQSNIQMAQVARTRIFKEEICFGLERRTIHEACYVQQEFSFEVSERCPVRIEKIVTLKSSCGRGDTDCVDEVLQKIDQLENFNVLLRSHTKAWEQLWDRCDIKVLCDERTQLLIRFHIFHLLQTVSPHTINLDVGVPARGLHGEAYRGHIFWDELFIFPFLNFRIPEITRALLIYRYCRLSEARRAAYSSGYKGAMFPWQSGSDGREETQVVHLNPRSGRWNPDHTHLQRHVNAAIVFNIWQYYKATSDHEFIKSYGTEMVVEIARFLVSLTSYNSELERYEILGVMGPDEYHDAYPDTGEPGLRNNTYTNVMTAWVIWHTLRLLDCLPVNRRDEIRETMELSDHELAHWDAVSRRMRVVFHRDGVISQFEGYEQLKEFDWDRYRKKYGSIHRLDRLLEAEGDSPNRYKVSKQADVLMLFYLFSEDEVIELFSRLGYPFESKSIQKNIDYYLERTSDGSTLSSIVSSWLLSMSDLSQSWLLLGHALESDVSDVQGGTTPEGIHLGVMAGTLDVVQRCYTGLMVRDEVIWLNPVPPQSLQRLWVPIYYQQQWIHLEIRKNRFVVKLRKDARKIVKVGFKNQVYELDPGDSREFKL